MKGRILKEDRKGFTLVELIVVIAILAILAAVAYPVYNGYIDYTHKGVDRQTVGEIMHAIELADYSDPNLIGEGETATVYLTSGKAAAYNGNKSTELESALNDAFGDYTTLKLSYDWESGIGVSELNELLTKITTATDDSYKFINDYIDGTGVASFAGDVSEYWTDVETLLGQYGKAHNKDDYLARVINYTTAHKNELWQAVVSGDPDSFPQDQDTQAHLGAVVAANYSFVSWLEDNHADVLEKDEKIKEYVAGVKLKDGELDTAFYAQIDNLGDDYDKLVQEYRESGQAEVDAKAFVGMMEAASSYANEGGELPKDNDFVPLVQKVVNSAAALLDRSTDLTNLSNLASELSSSGGSIVTVTATKKNGVLTVYPTPKDAGPDDYKSEAAQPEEIHCSETVHDLTLALEISRKGNLTLVDPSDDNQLEICHIESQYSFCSFNPTDNAFGTDLSITACTADRGGIISWTSSGITALATGETTVEITVSYKIDKDTTKSVTGSIKVVVH